MTTPIDHTAVVPCCVPSDHPGPELAHAETLAASLKALADPTRLRLITLITAHDGGEACVCDLTAPVGLSQPTVSHHLKILVDAGFLTREQRGRWAYYRYVADTLVDVAGELGAVGRPQPQDRPQNQ